MAIGLAEWAAMSAIISAMADVISIGRESFEVYLKRRRDSPDNQTKAAALAKTFSSYSDREIAAIKNRIDNCRDRYEREGAGAERQMCFCSVLTDVKEGNGGTIPDDEWEEFYINLGCKALLA